MTPSITCILGRLRASCVLLLLLNCSTPGALLFDTLGQPSAPEDAYPLDAVFWAGQEFNSGQADLLTSVSLNLFRYDDVQPDGTFFVRLYTQVPSTLEPGAFVTLAERQSIAALDAIRHSRNEVHDSIFTLSGLQALLTPNTSYYLVVGGEAGASEFQWGYTTRDTGLGCPSLYVETWDAGRSWREPDYYYPQRMAITAITAVPEPAQTAGYAAALCAAVALLHARRPKTRRLAPPHGSCVGKARSPLRAASPHLPWGTGLH